MVLGVVVIPASYFAVSRMSEGDASKAFFA